MDRANLRKAPLALIPPLILLLLAPAISAQYTVLYPEKFESASFVGSETCTGCHDELAEALHEGLHAGVLDEGEMGCESCHGPGSLHVESGETADILMPTGIDGALSSSLCLQCHGLGDAAMFEHTAHAMNEVSCVSCHSVHGEQRAGLLVKREPGLCNDCHKDIEAMTYLPSHHPIREHKMICTDCHDVHSDGYANSVAGERPTDLCFSCHADKQGPFIFEHAPVTEDCGICHNPHGTVANNLLTQNEPFLCLQCHQMHFHTQLDGVEGDIMVGGETGTKDGYEGASHHDSVKRAFLTSCSRCHTQVHGSDLPSQGISGQGEALTR